MSDAEKKELFLDFQDELWTLYPKEVDSIYINIRKATNKEPRPSTVVRKFADTYPLLTPENIKNTLEYL